MTKLVGAELLKLRTTRAVPALLAVSVGLSVLMAALIVLLSSTSDIGGATGGRLVLSSGGIVAYDSPAMNGSSKAAHLRCWTRISVFSGSMRASSAAPSRR